MNTHGQANSPSTRFWSVPMGQNPHGSTQPAAAQEEQQACLLLLLHARASARSQMASDGGARCSALGGSDPHPQPWQPHCQASHEPLSWTLFTATLATPMTQHVTMWMRL